MCKKMNKKSIIYIMHLTIICIRSIIHIKKGTIFAPLNKKMEETIMEHRIKELIKERGYTQEEFARLVGTTRVGLGKNLVCPSGSTLEKIAEALGVEMWELFASKDEIVNKDKNVICCPKCGARFELKE